MVSKKRDRTHRQLAVYADLCCRCAVCWWRKGRFGRALHLHHIVGRRGLDYHDHRNLICVCNECHDGYHIGGQRDLSLGHVLQAKLEEDGELDLEFLAKLLHRVGLKEDPKPLPQWARDERVANASR